MEYTENYDSPLGKIMLASDGENLTGLWFADGRTTPDPSFFIQGVKLPLFDMTAKWLDTYFSGNEPDFTPPLKVNASPFRRRVCQIMLTIPYGETMTYGEISEIIGRERGVGTMFAQAVGGAVGHNPISIIIPCHRVMGAKGKLTGYGGGIKRKIKLLALEGVNIPQV